MRITLGRTLASVVIFSVATFCVVGTGIGINAVNALYSTIPADKAGMLDMDRSVIALFPQMVTSRDTSCRITAMPAPVMICPLSRGDFFNLRAAISGPPASAPETGDNL